MFLKLVQFLYGNSTFIGAIMRLQAFIFAVKNRKLDFL